MNSFDDRKRAHEAKYAHDADLQFKVIARRNKMLGLWVAEQVGKTGDAALEYALSVVAADFEQVGDEDVLRKVVADLKAAGLDVSQHRVRKRMDELFLEARKQLSESAPE